MLRKIIGIISGYVVMFLLVMVTYTVLYLILGTETTFEAGSYNVSTTWIVLSLILSVIAAAAGGYVCTLIVKSRRTTNILAGIVLALGIIFALPKLGGEKMSTGNVRKGNVSNIEAMQKAKEPDAVQIISPFLGAAGIILGSFIRKPQRQSEVQRRPTA